MFISFSKRLKRMSGFRIGKRFKLKGWTVAVFFIFIAMFYLMWWSLLAALWMIYGVCWLCFYLPYKLIKGKTANNNSTTQINENISPENKRDNFVVYVSGTGKCYHQDKNCGGASYTTRITVKNAESKGYKKCSKCCKAYFL